MRLKNRKGTSIIEAAVAIALISIMLLWAAGLYTNSSKNVVTTADIEAATHLASERIEHLKTLTKGEINNELPSGSSYQTASSPYENYEYKYIYPNSPNTPDWTEGGGGTVSLINVEVDVRKKGTTNPLIKMECNFLRKDSDGTNLGL